MFRLVEKKLKNGETFNYSELSDEKLITIIHEGQTEALNYLIKKYTSFVWLKSRSYFIIGGDQEDVMQEGVIGLYKAIRDYNPEKLSSFKGFAELCITRQIITAIKTATRQKHIPLNSSISLDRPVYVEESERTMLDILPGPSLENPADLIVYKENSQHMKVEVHKVLSRLERQVLALYLDGQSYQEISVQLNRQVKSVDNALQRIKKKLELHLENQNVYVALQ